MGDHPAFPPLENDLQAVDRGILATHESHERGSLGRNQETSQRPLSMRFLECDRFFPNFYQIRLVDPFFGFHR